MVSGIHDSQNGAAAYGINDAGTVVGVVEYLPDINNATILEQGFMDQNGVFTTFDLPFPTTSMTPTDINDLGQITGDATLPDGTQEGFLLTPVPEPTVIRLLALFCVFGLAVGFRRNFSKRLSRRRV